MGRMSVEAEACMCSHGLSRAASVWTCLEAALSQEIWRANLGPRQILKPFLAVRMCPADPPDLFCTGLAEEAPW